MNPQYHSDLIAGQVERAREASGLRALLAGDIEQDGEMVFVPLFGRRRGNDVYLARIDMSEYPVEPYEVGFIKPDVVGDDRLRVSDRDPRYWPWSPMPGLHGSFNIHYPGPIRVFWCRSATQAFFFYHGAEEGKCWDPANWPLDIVIRELVDAVLVAEHPRHWRPVQRLLLEKLFSLKQQPIPHGAGIDDR